MATDLETRKSSSKSATYLQRKFADLCARIRHVDRVAHLLVLSLIIFVYAFLVGGFDWFVGSSTAQAVEATRWIGYAAFLLVLAFALVQTARAFFRSVNPYYVAHQLEQTLPDAKNSLINWLDLHDEDIPSAFQKTLSTRAEEQMQEADADQTVRQRKNWLLLGILGMPTIGLLVLLAFGPPALLSSLLRGFYPFYTPALVTRTQITLVQPDAGGAEVLPTQSIAFVAKIDGSFPTGIRADAPTLHYRYQPNEDFRTLPLQQTDTTWTAQLQPTEIRTGFTYKVSAGDAETPEHQVRVRGPAHVTKFEIAYQHRAYRKLPNRTVVFPNRDFAKPLIHGPRGSEVAMIVYTSRPVKKAGVELLLKDAKAALPIRLLPNEPQAFACKLTLEQAGQFRVLFTTTTDEENCDREWYSIQVPEDEAPQVVLTQPGKDVSMAENGTLEVAGFTTSDIGLKALTLHLRTLTGPKVLLLSKPYRPGESFRLDDGSFHDRIDYLEILALDEIKDDKGVIWRPAVGSMLEYWVEAADCTDTPDPKGRLGNSPIYKITLAKAQAPAQAKAQRDKALQRQKEHAKQQDSAHAKENQDKKEKRAGGTGEPDPQKQLNAAKQENMKTEDKLNQTKKEQDRGGAKSAEQPSADKKDGPQPGDAGAEPQAKNQAPMSPDDAGSDKGQGQGDPGKPKDNGEKETAKDGPAEGSAKGIEQQGPDTSNKDQQSAMNPTQPGAKAKGGMMADAGSAKAEPKLEEGPGAGDARGDGPSTGKQEPAPGQVAQLVEQLSDRDGKADEAAKALAKLGADSNDPRLRALLPEILKQNGRDPKTGLEEKNGPNTFGSGGPTKGVIDDIKAAAVNREFTAKLGQMQLDDWKKRVTPDFLKKAGLSQTDWQRYVKSMQSYDALVRRLNAQQIRDAEKKALLGQGGTLSSVGPSLVEGKGTRNTPLDAGNSLPPPEILDAYNRFTNPKNR